MTSINKIYLVGVLFIGLLVLNACDLDNYEEPDIILQGKVVDEETGENIQTRQPNGIKIRLLEEGFDKPVPYDFWAKSDGSFRNTKIFKAKYSVKVMEGPFEQSSVNEKAVDLNRDVDDLTFEVVPYVRLKNVNINKSGTNSIKANYEITGTENGRKILKSMLIVHTSPILHQNTTNKLSSSVNDLSSVANSDIESMSFQDNISNLNEGETYYARVAVLTENTLNRYNYSEIIEIEL